MTKITEKKCSRMKNNMFQSMSNESNKKNRSGKMFEYLQWQNIFNSKTMESNLTGFKCVFGFEYFTKSIEMCTILAFGNFLKHYLSWNIYKNDDNCFNKSESSKLLKSISARRNIVQFIKTQFMPFIFIPLVI